MAVHLDPLRDFYADFRLDMSRVGLLIIDMQYASASRNRGLGRLLEERGEGLLGQWRFDRLESAAIANCNRLLDTFRQNSGRVFFITTGSYTGDYRDVPTYLRGLVQYTSNVVGSPNHRILEELTPLPAEPVLNKTTSSAFLGTCLDLILRGCGINQLVLCGVSTGACVEGTGRDGADLGYDCMLVEDACSCACEDTHRAAVQSFGRLIGRVASTEGVIEELLPEATVSRD